MLIVTARCTQAYKDAGQYGPLGFVAYKDEEGQRLTGKELATHDRVIVQYESLHKLLMGTSGGLLPFD